MMMITFSLREILPLAHHAAALLHFIPNFGAILSVDDAVQLPIAYLVGELCHPPFRGFLRRLHRYFRFHVRHGFRTAFHRPLRLQSFFHFHGRPGFHTACDRTLRLQSFFHFHACDRLLRRHSCSEY